VQQTTPHGDEPLTPRDLAMMALAAVATPFALAALLIAVYWLMWPFP
jgi:hypothetical protein